MEHGILGQGTSFHERRSSERLFHRDLPGGGYVAIDLNAGTAAERMEQPPPRPVLDSLKESLGDSPGALVEPEETVKLAEAIRVLALRHGAQAVRHCLVLVQNLRSLLDSVGGQESEDRKQA